MISIENDPYKEFSEEHIKKWCLDNDFPINFFRMSVEERRREVYNNWKRKQMKEQLDNRKKE